MPVITISREGQEPVRYPIKKRIVSIGRSSQCDVVLPEADVSSIHANLVYSADEQCRVIDSGSTNGTFVQGKKIQEHLLHDGDEIRVGKFHLVFSTFESLEDTVVISVSDDHLARSQKMLLDIKSDKLSRLIDKPQDPEAGQALRQALDDLDRVLSEAQRSHEQVKLLLSMAELINSAKGFESVLTAILNSAMAATGMERGAVVLYNDEKKLEPVVAVGLEKESGVLSSSVIQRAVENGTPAIFSDIDQDQDLREARSIVAQNIRATVCLPLRSRTAKILGVLYLDSRLSAINKTTIAPEFLRMFGLFAATAIQTRRMAEREKEISEELAAARERDKYQLQLKELEQENKRLVKKAREGRFGNMLGASEPMERLYSFIEKVAPTDVTVLITGETGTGKGVVARAIHDLSDRKAREFVTIDCASIPSELLESELFGHEKGAFTGAVAQKKGRIEAAEGGTLFMDEIGDMSLNLQAKLLRFLQEKSFERVGGNRTLTINVRVVAATNKDLRRAVAEKGFREDLYYRLCGVSLTVPPLRDRGGDAFVMANAFLNEVRDQNSLPIKGFSPEAKNAILHYSWQGNVRQLKNVIQRAAILCNGEFVGVEDLGLEAASAPSSQTLKEAREEIDRRLVLQHLLTNKGNLTRTARSLDIDRGTLREIMKKHGIEGEDDGNG